MTDATPEGLTDTPGPDATPEQEEHVRSLLAFLRDEPVPMPDDVIRRLDAVLAEERRGAAGPTTGGTGPDAALDAPGDATPLAPVTVLPAAAHRPSRSTRTLRVLGGLAAAAVVVVGAVSVSGSLRGDSSSTAGGTLAAAPSGASSTRITASGTAYSAATLQTQADALVASARSTTAPGGSAPAAAAASSPTTPAASTTSRAFVALSVTAAADCVRQLTQGDGSVALAVDTGLYDGQPALVVVIPTHGDPSKLDVWVVKTTCTATSADLLEFQRIPAP